MAKVKKESIKRNESVKWKQGNMLFTMHSNAWSETKICVKRMNKFIYLFWMLKTTHSHTPNCWFKTKTSTQHQWINTFRNGKMRPFGLNANSLLPIRMIETSTVDSIASSSIRPFQDAMRWCARCGECVCFDMCYIRPIAIATHRVFTFWCRALRAKENRRTKIDIRRMARTHTRALSFACSGVPGCLFWQRRLCMLARVCVVYEFKWNDVTVNVFFHFNFQMMTLLRSHAHTHSQPSNGNSACV